MKIYYVYLTYIVVSFVFDFGIGQIFSPSKRSHISMGMGAFDRNVEQLAGEDIAGAVKSTCKS